MLHYRLPIKAPSVVLSLLTACWIVHAPSCLAATPAAASASPSSFESQFSSTVHYGLAIAGISLGSAAAVALLGVLIFCLVRRRRKKHSKLTRSNTEASTSSSGHAHQQPMPQAKKLQSNFGPMALPVATTDVGASGEGRRHHVTDNGTRAAATAKSHSSADDGAASSKTSSIDAGRAQYTNGAFNGSDSAGLAGSGGGQLFRHSSFLRPVSYASLEPNKLREPPTSATATAAAAGPSAAITHPSVRTSPATTLDPRYFLSHDAGLNLQLQQQQQRMSLAEKASPQQQHQQLKRISYADPSSNVAFAASTAASVSVHHPPVQRFVIGQSSTPSLPAQPEAVARKTRQAPERPPQLGEGPSFPRMMMKTSPEQHQHQQQPQPVKKQQSLHRFQLGSGGDSHSVGSTVLKQEAIEAFEFLEGYDD